MACALIVLVVLAFPWTSVAEGGLRGQQTLSDPVSTIAQLHRTLSEPGSSPDVEQRVTELTEDMHPVFLALPRSADGYLDASAVRYLLHRLFLDRDGWFVQGWDASGEDADNALPKTVLQGDALANVFSEQLAARGLSLREVAVLAMAVETLASKETEKRLEFAFQYVTREDPRKVQLSEEQLHRIHIAYNVIYVMGLDYQNVEWATLYSLMSEMREAVPRWDEFQQWFSELRDELVALLPEEERLSFQGQVRILDEMEHRYGRWQDQSCRAIKQALLQHAIPGTGRVPLGKFYTATMPGGFVAGESKQYLEEIGALDQTDPRYPSVVVSNYFATPSNCMNTSVYYSACCISECEPLLSSLERKLGSPNAPPEQIVKIIESLPSATVEAPRTLPAQLVARLEVVAAMHGGHAPLHSRLFRQWMHHAYPSECVFPGLSMTRRPRTPDQYELEAGATLISDEEREQYALEEAERAAGHAASTQELPWSDEEELFVTCRSDGASEASAGEPAKRSFSWRAAVLVVFIAASMGSIIVKEARAARSQSCLLPSYQKAKGMV